MNSYLDELATELARAGVPGRTRSRILTEFADHLASDPAADLGSPTELARQFADELGTFRTRRSAATVFGALAFAGLLFAVAFVASTGLGHLTSPRSAVLGQIAILLFLLAPQFAFATGVLAALRALRRSRVPALSAAEATVIVRRAAFALSAGVMTMAALALIVIEFPHAGSSAWRAFCVIAAAVGIAALMAAAPSVLAAARVPPSGPGGAGDIFDDLGPLAPQRWRGHPWRPALAIAAFVAIAIAAAGFVGSDPYDGLLRGILDAAACLVCFAVLGPFLGLLPARP